jgi:Lrp/AsnC family transcriptional regulator for asnA, asnC and gidA
MRSRAAGGKSLRPHVPLAAASESDDMRASQAPPPQQLELDAVDRGILKALRADGRANNSVIAAEIGVAEGTVRQRMRKLTEAGVVRVSALVNPEIISEHQLCVLGINVQENKRLELCASEVSALPEVRSVAIVTGRYDLLVEVLVASNRGLIHFLSESLATVQGIQSSETFLLLKTYDKWI